MKVDVSRGVVVVIGNRGTLPPLIDTTGDRDVLVLALGPRIGREQQRAVEAAVAEAVDRRIALEARIATVGEAAAVLAAVSHDETIRLFGLTRRHRRALGAPGR
jgi:hypothetical protein